MGRPGRVVTAAVVAAAILVGAICLALMAANPNSGDAGIWSVQLGANLFTSRLAWSCGTPDRATGSGRS